MILESHVYRRDIVLMSCYYLPRLWVNAIWFAVLVALMGFIFRSNIESHGVGLWVGTSVFGSAVGFLSMWLFCVVLQSLFARESTGFIGPQRFAIEEKGFREYSGAGELFTPWHAVKRLDETKRYIYVMIPNYRVHVIPKRVFTSSADITAFLQQLREHFPKRS